MTELREKVARALSVPQHHTGWPLLSFAEKDLYYMQADAAISAVMQDLEAPSEEVLKHGGQEFAMTAQRGNTAEAHAKSIWTAMLSQYRKEQANDRHN